MNRAAEPRTIILSFSVLFAVLSALAVAAGLAKQGLLLNENKILYLFSTSDQVVAAIYGLTLTGLIFFRNELRWEEAEDETLADVLESLKHRYFVLMIFVSRPRRLLSTTEHHARTQDLAALPAAPAAGAPAQRYAGIHDRSLVLSHGA